MRHVEPSYILSTVESHFGWPIHPGGLSYKFTNSIANGDVTKNFQSNQRVYWIKARMLWSLEDRSVTI